MVSSLGLVSPFAYVLGSWTNISGSTLAAVPAHRLCYRLSQWDGVLAERLLELGVVHHEGFLELVEHLDGLADPRVEQAYRPQQDLRRRLEACRPADLLGDRLNELARRDGLGIGQVPRLPQGLLALSQDNQPPADVGGVGKILGERTAICEPVHVEVLHRYELRPGARCSFYHPGLQRREQLGPLMVGWVE